MKVAFLQGAAAALVTGAGAMHVERQMRETVRAAFAVPGLINNEGLVMDAGANNGQVRPHCHYHRGPFSTAAAAAAAAAAATPPACAASGSTPHQLALPL